MLPVIAKLNTILHTHALKRVNGKAASHSTTTSAGQTLRTCFKDLVSLGYRLQDPTNLEQKHIRALCEHWHKEGRAVSTIQERLSRLRIFAGWVKKPGMVKKLAVYLPNVPPAELRLRKVTTASKSWSENGIDVTAKILAADQVDMRFGLMLRLALSFGLRRMEVVQLRPWKSDHGERLAVYHAKNGRPRDIPIVTPEQRVVLDSVKAQVRKGEHVGWKHTSKGQEATLEYSIGKYNKCMAAIGITRVESGVTGHGLRAQYAENAALIAALIPPTLGGTGGQMLREDLMIKREQVSELLGHSRASITGAYYGTFGRKTPPDQVDRCKFHIEKAISAIRPGDVIAVPGERAGDVADLLRELMAIGIDITGKQAHHLWAIHSQRHASNWASLQERNIEALEAAAIKLNKKIDAEAQNQLALWGGSAKPLGA
ncbi:MAG: integrase domain-containing protein [Burkholderiaceae bacterium]|nr:integrase domain-containing protein [Burkholderiaceae bacterium]